MRSVPALAAASLLALAGCFGAAPVSGKYYCRDTTQCLSGHVCYQGYCCKRDTATGLCVDHPCLSQGTDSDRDGFPLCAGDCDDADPSVRPGAQEACDGRDNNCDGAIDEGVGLLRHRDLDGDGHGSASPNDALMVCQETPGLLPSSDDCDDGNPLRFVGNPEVCDGVDNDCNGEADEGVTSVWHLDADGDGFGRTDSPKKACERPEGYAKLKDDCDDQSPLVNPGANESCNGADDDCDGVTDEGVKVDIYPDRDADGFGDKAAIPSQACSPGPGESLNALDCDDGAPTINPAAYEVCNSADDDCDGLKDEGVATLYFPDADGDGYGARTGGAPACSAPAGQVADNSDCNDGSALINPSRPESCNGADDDCDGLTDEGLVQTYFRDADGDGFGNPASQLSSCPPAPQNPKHVDNSADCNDSRADSFPGAPELCDAADNDCDGVKDNTPTCGPRLDQAEVAAAWGAGYATGSGANNLPGGCLALTASATALPVQQDASFKSAGQASVKLEDNSARDFFAYFPLQRSAAWSLSGQVFRFDAAGSAPSWDSAFRQPLVMFCAGSGFARYQPAAQGLSSAFAGFTINIPANTSSGGPWSYGGGFSWSRVDWIELHANNGAPSGTALLWLDDVRFAPQ